MEPQEPITRELIFDSQTNVNISSEHPENEEVIHPPIKNIIYVYQNDQQQIIQSEQQIQLFDLLNTWGLSSLYNYLNGKNFSKFQCKLTFILFLFTYKTNLFLSEISNINLI